MSTLGSSNTELTTETNSFCVTITIDYLVLHFLDKHSHLSELAVTTKPTLILWNLPSLSSQSSYEFVTTLTLLQARLPPVHFHVSESSDQIGRSNTKALHHITFRCVRFGSSDTGGPMYKLGLKWKTLSRHNTLGRKVSLCSGIQVLYSTFCAAGTFNLNIILLSK
jgi:hypothetical protein